MGYTKNTIVLLLAIAVLSVCLWDAKRERLKVLREVSILKEEIRSRDSLNEVISKEKDYLEQEVRYREDEVAYWGMKYDSLRNGNN